jgi:3-hydroxyisobutyrate dehydrogenase
MAPIRTIAFVGLGNMGTPMAARLAAAGFSLALYDKRDDVMRVFADVQGGRIAKSPTDAGRGADAAITMLPTDKIVREVVLGEGGLAAALTLGAIVIDMSTSDPRATVEIGKAVAARGLRYVDAPVMGGVVFAKDGSLDIMVGGYDEDIERCMPIFEALGRQVFRCGALGSGHALKALANYVNACAMSNIIEALAIGRKFGLESNVMAEAMQHMCTGRQHPLDKKVIPQVLTRKFSTGMALGLIAKDVGIAADFGRSIGAMTPLADCLSRIWRQAEAEIGGNADQTEIAKFWEKRDGVTL